MNCCGLMVLKDRNKQMYEKEKRKKTVLLTPLKKGMTENKCL